MPQVIGRKYASDRSINGTTRKKQIREPFCGSDHQKQEARGTRKKMVHDTRRKSGRAHVAFCSGWCICYGALVDSGGGGGGGQQRVEHTGGSCDKDMRAVKTVDSPLFGQWVGACRFVVPERCRTSHMVPTALPLLLVPSLCKKKKKLDSHFFSSRNRQDWPLDHTKLFSLCPCRSPRALLHPLVAKSITSKYRPSPSAVWASRWDTGHGLAKAGTVRSTTEKNKNLEGVPQTEATHSRAGVSSWRVLTPTPPPSNYVVTTRRMACVQKDNPQAAAAVGAATATTPPLHGFHTSNDRGLSGSGADSFSFLVILSKLSSM